VSEEVKIEKGETYEFVGWPESQIGRKAVVLSVDGGLCETRWPNGMTYTTWASHLRGPVEPARPGVDEPCLLCGGTKEVEEKYNDPAEPMFLRSGGMKPCPNCDPQ
jgi:hypothetical protein